jgi:hypothetical protein
MLCVGGSPPCSSSDESPVRLPLAGSRSIGRSDSGRRMGGRAAMRCGREAAACRRASSRPASVSSSVELVDVHAAADSLTRSSAAESTLQPQLAIASPAACRVESPLDRGRRIQHPLLHSCRLVSTYACCGLLHGGSLAHLARAAATAGDERRREQPAHITCTCSCSERVRRVRALHSCSCHAHAKYSHVPPQLQVWAPRL